ncbi:energy transducer TonB [Fulvivirga sp. RKSG066]|uniref:energy transducer TonB n=1 Tax=Fulvivirga aurantia TaxID=2529383 RepID=UPI0012BB515C|nr:energy transducer TonB [Fulvivirga aurantia]MTI22663.1 energy transducer TonB [Fulvivirga aurantia]
MQTKKIYKRDSILIAGVVTLSLLFSACTSSNEKDESTEDDKEMIEEQSDANMSSTGMLHEADFDKTLEEYTVKYPELEYTYIETKDGKLATTKGNYQLKVEGIDNQSDLDKFVAYVEANYAMKRENTNTNVEVAAKPQGGFDGYYEALKNNTSYPKEALKADVGGTVFVEFVVDDKGQVSNVKAMEGMYYTKERAFMDELDAAAVEAVKETQWDWIPAKQGGKPVKMKMEIPITFDPEA